MSIQVRHDLSFKDLIQKQMPEIDFSILKKRERDVLIHLKIKNMKRYIKHCQSIYDLKYIQCVIIRSTCSFIIFFSNKILDVFNLKRMSGDTTKSFHKELYGTKLPFPEQGFATEILISDNVLKRILQTIHSVI